MDAIDVRQIIERYRDRHNIIVISHQTTDPAYWVLRHWRVSWWRKRRVLSLWFTDLKQALQVADDLRAKLEGTGPIHHG